MTETCLSPGCSSYLSGPIGQVFTTSLQFIFAAQCMISSDWPPDSSNNITDLVFDYIVVGAGSAGSVVAARLSEDACRRVLLVEAGGDPPFESQVPAANWFMVNTQYDWQFKTEYEPNACQSTGGICSIPAGKMLGGGSSINSMFYVRGNRQDYDDIASAGNEGWDYATALKYFKKSENMTDDLLKNTQFHNSSGPLHVSVYDNLTEFDEMILKGYTEAGFELGSDYNGLNQLGIFRLQTTIKDGKRASTATSYLVPARDRPNLVILKHALATKILIENNKATGIRILLNNKTEIEATATKDVIISAGAIKTPHLLLLSGIGPRAHLDDFNIPVIADLAVGQNLIDHVALFVPVRVRAPIRFQTDSAIPLDVAKYILFGTGYYNHEHYPGFNVIAFVNTRGDLPNFRISIQTYASDSETAIMNFFLDFLAEASRGNVTLRSTNPTDYPKIKGNYFENEKDIENFLEAIELIDTLTKTPSFKFVEAKIDRISAIECDDIKFLSTEYWRCIIKHRVTSSIHVRGTAKMGPESDPNAVVNSKLQVYGVENLRIVDASVIPSTIRGNINAPVIMIAERASDLIKADHADDHCE